jgi:hypothetical protein
MRRIPLHIIEIMMVRSREERQNIEGRWHKLLILFWLLTHRKSGDGASTARVGPQARIEDHESIMPDSQLITCNQIWNICCFNS